MLLKKFIPLEKQIVDFKFKKFGSSKKYIRIIVTAEALISLLTLWTSETITDDFLLSRKMLICSFFLITLFSTIYRAFFLRADEDISLPVMSYASASRALIHYISLVVI